MKQLTILTALLLAVSLPGSSATVPAEADSAVFARANRAYKTGDYPAALKDYQELARRISNPGLFLNLGNAAYKSGQPGRAILSWERGLRLEPDHAELKANLLFARDRLVDKSGEDSSGLGETVYSIYRGVDLDTLLMVTALAWWLLLGSLFALYWYDVSLAGTLSALFSWFEAPASLRLAALFLPALALLGTSGGWVAARLHEDAIPRAIVLEKEVKATSGPGADPTVVFAIHEGTRVTVIRRSDHWAQISLANGYTGWVPETAIEEIVKGTADR